MNRISIEVDNIVEVLTYYQVIKVYSSNDPNGQFTELTNPSTRIAMYAAYRVYYYDDPNGGSSTWYKTSYFNTTSLAESLLSDPIQGGVTVGKVGYTFKNYEAPPGTWGKAVTADDMRFTYLWGVDCQGSDVAQTVFTDSQFDYFVDKATAEIETYLTLDIFKHVRKTFPLTQTNPTTGLPLVKAPRWRSGADYTDEEFTYEFDPVQWMNFGFLQLRHWPVISIERYQWFNPVHGKIMDFIVNKWIRLKAEIGQLNTYPTTGLGYGPYSIASLAFRGMSVRYDGGFEVDYTTGYPSSDFIPGDLREIIGKWAAILVMGNIADGLLAGFSSSSVSLDGLSESFSSTQSPMNTWFGARTRQYMDEVKHYLERNRYKHGAFPMSFVGT